MPRIKGKKGFPLSEETKRKIGLANRGVWTKFNCDYCGKENEEKQSHFKRKKKHFCKMNCYSSFVKEKLPLSEQNAYKGVRKDGESKQVYHRNYCKRNPKRIAHLKARRHARKKGAEGSHTLKEWENLKAKFNYKCVFCKKETKLTKDHIVPLSKGGSDYIENIQPLCQSCNSKKWQFINYENPELLGK